MTIWQTQILKDRTEDGIFELDPSGHFRVGDALEIDIDSRRLETYEGADGQSVQMEIVEAYDTSPNKIAWPCECLDL